MAIPMEAHHEIDPRFVRGASTPRLADAAAAPPALPEESADLLSRLEHQAEECGRLMGRIDALEQRLRAERDARRRLLETVKRERGAAKVLAERADRAEASVALLSEESQRFQSAAESSERALDAAWTHIATVERQLAWAERPAWRKLLHRPPKSA
jgi:chromosome segregation ATPase